MGCRWEDTNRALLCGAEEVSLVFPGFFLLFFDLFTFSFFSVASYWL